MLRKVAEEILSMPQLEGFFARLGTNVRSQLIYGFDSSARSMLMSSIRLKTGRPVLIIASDPLRAAKIYEDMVSIFGEEETFLFPGRELLYFYALLSESYDIPQQRISVMRSLSKGKNTVIVTTVAGLITKMPPYSRWKRSCTVLQKGQDWEIHKLLAHLVEVGYERTEIVEVPGHVAIRGGIVDLFPAGETMPYRIEYFGDTIDSIRRFDPGTQRSFEQVEKLQVVPAREVVVGPGERQIALADLAKEQQWVEESMQRSDQAGKHRLKEKLGEHIEKMGEEAYFPGIDQYLLYFYPNPSSILEYLSEQTLVFVDDPLRCEQVEAQLSAERREIQSTLLAQGELLARQSDLTWEYPDLLQGTKLQVVGFSLFAHNLGSRPYTHSISLSYKPVPRFLGQWDLFGDELKHWRGQGYRIVILTSTQERAKAMLEMLDERNIASFYSQKVTELSPKAVVLVHGGLENGFIIPAVKLVVLTEQDILPQRKKQRRIKGKEGVRVGDYQEMQVGDYVVHEQHGIGQYLGLRTLEVAGTNRDYLFIQYAGNDKLFIPIGQLDAVRKYIGVEGKKPKLNALGGGEWSRIKARVQASIQELAKELLALYAIRETASGYAFSADHSWQKDFEDAFPYEETADQLRSTQEVKADMEKTAAMDRLLCGDVGYGKTEVALRAAFKAVMDGTQVVFLVPTTVLAQQHYRTFLERLEGFPVTVDILSRFQTAADQKATLQGLRDGRIDIVIGTHRLLSRDIRFQNLGLLVIDEEQRFGVRHKEKIKMLKKNVDVLTMTATPIPRTLHMALVGVRNMSMIETPPENRYPIQTYVLEYSDTLIREAVLREISRGGQIYFVHNRVQSIEKCAANLQKLLPKVRIGVAHGQLPEDRLERVMIAFLQREYDMLLSTTIVEAGLDIPNVNTIIIHDADKFGLAQLYQLRGRVGRSNRIAYCYLTYQKDKVLTEVAEKRLQAIKEFTELGSGFKIALRDLEIRGAGNILGPEQHGFMMAVGFDLYVKLLEEAIQMYKGEQPEKKMLPRVEINVDAFLPAAYISDARQKIVFYQKVASLQNADEVKEVREELTDRFGPLPKAAENLLHVSYIRLEAQELGIASISEEKNEIQIRFNSENRPNGETMLALTKKFKVRLIAGAGKQYMLSCTAVRGGDGKLKFLLELFSYLKRLVNINACRL